MGGWGDGGRHEKKCQRAARKAERFGSKGVTGVKVGGRTVMVMFCGQVRREKNEKR